MSNYFKSENISIFPCGNRNAEYAASAKHLTESNLTHIHGLAFGEDSYIVQVTDSKCELVIKGYHFVVTFESDGKDGITKDQFLNSYLYIGLDLDTSMLAAVTFNRDQFSVGSSDIDSKDKDSDDTYCKALYVSGTQLHNQLTNIFMLSPQNCLKLYETSMIDVEALNTWKGTHETGHAPSAAQIDSDIEDAVAGEADLREAADTAIIDTLGTGFDKVDNTVAKKIAAVEAAAKAHAETQASAAQSAAETTAESKDAARDQAAAKTYATKTELGAVEDKADSNTNLITNLTGRLDDIVAQGGEPNAINKIKVNGEELGITNKTVEISVPVIENTKVSQLNDGQALLNDVTQAKADIVALSTSVQGANTGIAGLTTRISTIEETLNGGEGDSGGLVEEVAANTRAIAGEAVARKEAIGKAADGETAATGVYAAIAEALQDAKDYADAQDADTVYDDTALAAHVKAIEDDYLKEADKYDDTDLVKQVTRVETAINDLKNFITANLIAVAFVKDTTVVTRVLIANAELPNTSDIFNEEGEWYSQPDEGEVVITATSNLVVYYHSPVSSD
jgi:hypothetical protein